MYGSIFEMERTAGIPTSYDLRLMLIAMKLHLLIDAP